MNSTDELTVMAAAKINLALDVVGRRPEGYHTVDMVMQSIAVYDSVSVRKKNEPGIDIVCNVPELAGEGNIAVKAARRMCDMYSIGGGMTITIEKRIPMAAGLAGGSTDAAAVIVAVNSLYGLGLTDKELRDVGVKVGADVPFCLMGGAARAQGIGEVLTSLKTCDCTVVIAKPPVAVSTKAVYEAVDAGNYPHPDVDAVCGSLEAGDIRRVAALMENSLEAVTGQMYPAIGALEDILRENGAAGAMMSGSGPTVFGLFEDERDAQRAAEELKASGLCSDVAVTGFCRGNHYAG